MFSGPLLNPVWLEWVYTALILLGVQKRPWGVHVPSRVLLRLSFVVSVPCMASPCMPLDLFEAMRFALFCFLQGEPPNLEGLPWILSIQSQRQMSRAKTYERSDLPLFVEGPRLIYMQDVPHYYYVLLLDASLSDAESDDPGERKSAFFVSARPFLLYLSFSRSPVFGCKTQSAVPSILM